MAYQGCWSQGPAANYFQLYPIISGRLISKTDKQGYIDYVSQPKLGYSVRFISKPDIKKNDNFSKSKKFSTNFFRSKSSETSRKLIFENEHFWGRGGVSESSTRKILFYELDCPVKSYRFISKLYLQTSFPAAKFNAA